jgi:Flp pilus assembly protein TadB
MICLVVLGATVGGALALVVSPVLGIALRRRGDRDRLHLTDHEVARLPLVVDLAAVLLTCGQPLTTALDIAAGCAGTEGEARLRQVSGLLRLGAEPALAWRPIAVEQALRPLAIAATRSADSGIALATTFGQAAAELRAQARARVKRRAERVGVWAIAPLGLCFLPAFVCLGIVPMIIGVAQPLLTSIAP